MRKSAKLRDMDPKGKVTRPVPKKPKARKPATPKKPRAKKPAVPKLAKAVKGLRGARAGRPKKRPAGAGLSALAGLGEGLPTGPSPLNLDLAGRLRG